MFQDSVKISNYIFVIHLFEFENLNTKEVTKLLVSFIFCKFQS
jgi:hypothetical protein